MSNPIRYSNVPSQPDYSGLQVAPGPVESSPEVVPGEGKIIYSYEALKHDDTLYSPKNELLPAPDHPPATAPKTKDKKRWPRKKKPAQDPDPSDNTNSTTTSTVSNEPSSLALDSSLSAVVWTTSDGGFVRYVVDNAPSNGSLAYSMSTGSGAPDDSKWEKALNLEPHQLRQYAGDVTRALVPLQHQLEVFYLNETNRINGENHNRAKGWGYDGINEKGFTALPESDLSAYWPCIVYQSREVSLQMVIWTGKFDSSDLSIRPTRGSQLGLVPTTRNYTKMVTHGCISLFYQDEAGKLIAFENSLKIKIAEGDKDANVTDVVWSSTFPDIRLPNTGHFSVFSLASNSNKTVDTVDTLVLYRDDSQKIQQNIDEWSKIACVTPPMWTNAEEQMRLASASDLTRCFFQGSGRLMEVQFDGAAWKAPKEVPLT